MAVKPLGFPIEVGLGGLIVARRVGHARNRDSRRRWCRAACTARVVVYPTPLASMTEALERLIQEPYGCFEQTSSTTYPLVMAQQYFMSHQGVDPSLIERSAEILETGYDRLIGFECKSGGYEWFGDDPGHDALTAYGLLEFTDMSQVRHVDPAMLERTRNWLLAQRDGKGGFARKTHTLHTWLPDPEMSNAYNTWALLEAGIDADLATEVQWIRGAAEATENTYVMALAANVLALAGDKEGENHLLDKLAGKQTEDGSLSGATKSVVGSGGEALTIETTSLAVMAWLKNPSYAANVEKSIKYLAETLQGRPLRLDPVDRAGPAGDRRLRPVASQTQSARQSATGGRRPASRRAGRLHDRHAGRDRTARHRRSADPGQAQDRRSRWPTARKCPTRWRSTTTASSPIRPSDCKLHLEAAAQRHRSTKGR